MKLFHVLVIAGLVTLLISSMALTSVRFDSHAAALKALPAFNTFSADDSFYSGTTPVFNRAPQPENAKESAWDFFELFLYQYLACVNSAERQHQQCLNDIPLGDPQQVNIRTQQCNDQLNSRLATCLSNFEGQLNTY